MIYFCTSNEKYHCNTM